MQPYERFLAWQVSHELALRVYEMTECWPKSERYELTAQARRSAFSVPCNVVEGSARRGRKEFRRFLDISLGSLAELGYTLRFARDRGLLRDDWWKEVEALRNRAGQLLWRLSQTLREETG